MHHSRLVNWVNRRMRSDGRSIQATLRQEVAAGLRRRASIHINRRVHSHTRSCMFGLLVRLLRYMFSAFVACVLAGRVFGLSYFMGCPTAVDVVEQYVKSCPSSAAL